MKSLSTSRPEGKPGRGSASAHIAAHGDGRIVPPIRLLQGSNVAVYSSEVSRQFRLQDLPIMPLASECDLQFVLCVQELC
jgi:hypothetical protein